MNDIFQVDYLPDEKKIKINLPEEVWKNIDTVIMTRLFQEELVVEKQKEKALEKQVPQKVKKYKGLNETACPECGIAFGYYEYDDEKFDYCYNCGQKLDWESEVEHDA